MLKMEQDVKSTEKMTGKMADSMGSSYIRSKKAGQTGIEEEMARKNVRESAKARRKMIQLPLRENLKQKCGQPGAQRDV